jgi:hypothetical protein
MSYFPADPALPESLSTLVVGWARGLPALRHRHPGLPKDWHPVLSVDPSEPTRPLLKGSMWLYYQGRVREVYAAQYEVVDGKERPI